MKVIYSLFGWGIYHIWMCIIPAWACMFSIDPIIVSTLAWRKTPLLKNRSRNFKLVWNVQYHYETGNCKYGLYIVPSHTVHCETVVFILLPDFKDVANMTTYWHAKLKMYYSQLLEFLFNGTSIFGTRDCSCYIADYYTTSLFHLMALSQLLQDYMQQKFVQEVKYFIYCNKSMEIIVK